MVITKTSCCAIQDIDRLSDHKDARSAMRAFCDQALTSPPIFMGPTDRGRTDEISSFYLFTAVVRKGLTYGEDFYQFIKDNDLGEVYQSPTRPNKAWHPDHHNQVYVWMPDKNALKRWWKENQ